MMTMSLLATTAKNLEFDSERAEADWYVSLEGKEQTRREFEKALRDGTLCFSRGSNMIRTDPAVLARLIEQAREAIRT